MTKSFIKYLPFISIFLISSASMAQKSTTKPFKEVIKKQETDTRPEKEIKKQELRKAPAKLFTDSTSRQRFKNEIFWRKEY